MAVTTKTVKVRGKEYTINPFSDYHMSTLGKLDKDPGNLQYQFDVAFVLKEIILPDLPYDVIRKTNDDKYIFLIHAHEISSIISSVIRYYYETGIERANSDGDKTLAEQFQLNLDEMNRRLAPSAANDKDQKIADLQKRLEEKQIATIDVIAETDKDKRIADLEAQLRTSD